MHLIELSIGWTIVFCPKFFTDLTYLNRILARPNVRESELGNLNLVSYEQVILHEVSVSRIYYNCVIDNSRTDQDEKSVDA